MFIIDRIFMMIAKLGLFVANLHFSLHIRLMMCVENEILGTTPPIIVNDALIFTGLLQNFLLCTHYPLR